MREEFTNNLALSGKGRRARGGKGAIDLDYTRFLTSKGFLSGSKPNNGRDMLDRALRLLKDRANLVQFILP